MTEALYWRLAYADDTTFDEDEDGCSIRLSPPGAVAVIVTERQPDGSRKPMVAEPLTELAAITLRSDPSRYVREVGCSPWFPIFYRIRSLAMDGSGPRTDVTIFGRARQAVGDSFDAVLWMVRRGGIVDNCPEPAIDMAAVQMLVEAHAAAYA